jgi:hypothetical protein
VVACGLSICTVSKKTINVIQVLTLILKDLLGTINYGNPLVVLWLVLHTRCHRTPGFRLAGQCYSSRVKGSGFAGFDRCGYSPAASQLVRETP